MSLLSIVQLTDTDYSLRMDPEYFQPHYETVRKQLPKGCETLLDLTSVKDGNHNAIADSYVNSGKRYLRGTDINDFFISDDPPIFITQETYDGLGRGYVKPGDILVSIVGTIGSVSLVAAWRDEMCANCKLAILRPHSMPSEVLASFFLTDTGQALLQMEVRGSVQQGIPLEGLEKMRIPPIPKQVWEPVRKLVVEASTIVKLGRDAYPAAEAELLERMRWQELEKQSDERCYVEDFQALESAERIDAEHFQPRYTSLQAFLEKRGAQTISELCHFVKHGVQPPYIEGGATPIVTQRQFGATGLEMTGVEHWTDEDYVSTNPDFVLKDGDVLTYCVSAGEYLGQTNLFRESTPAVAASFVTISRTRKLVPGYLALFLNSPAGLVQTNSSKRGTSPFYLYPRDLSKVLVYVPRTKSGQIDLAWQEKLAAKLESAARAKTEAREKLEAAKRLVEAAIARRPIKHS